MSNIFITDIIGQNTYDVPADDAELAAATTGLDSLISGITGLAYDRLLAWVEDAAGPDGAEGPGRTLNCLIEKFTYNGEECPDETEVDTLATAIENALEADIDITSVGQQQFHLFQAGAYFLWQRDYAGGFLYPNTTTDDVAVGGFVSPTGKWFDDGDLVLGGNTMTGTERLKVVGSAFIDQDSNGYGLDIDSEATGNPLLNLQPLNANTRGDIALSATRTSDPTTPSEGDVWYNATDECLKYYNGTDVICCSPGGFGNAFAEGSSDGTSTTNSTAYQQKLRVSVTGIDAGDYLIEWSYTWSYDAISRDFLGRVQIDDTTTIWNHQAEPQDTGADQLYAAAGIYVATLTSGDHDFDIDYAASNAIDTARISQVRLALWRVG